MFRDFFGAFADLFTERRNRLEISALLLTLAMLPVSELVVTRMFSHLILHGAERYQEDPDGVLVAATTFFVAFALSRAIHHVVRLNRVRVFRRGFDSSGEKRPASREAWSWAAAFELSTAMVSLIQVAALSLLFAWIDLRFGIANLLVAGAVLALIALIYRGQLRHQLTYLAEGARPGGTAVGERVRKRIRDAEIGAVVASLAMAASLGLVLFRAVRGGLAGADAFVLFIGLRMMYSQVGNLSASAMRFARVKARLDLRGNVGAALDPDPDDEFDPAEDAEELGPRPPSPHRTRLVEQMVLAGQRGDAAGVRRIGDRLARGGSAEEADARVAAEAYAATAAPVGGLDPIRLMWWPRPYPGSAGNWSAPLLVRRRTGRPVVLDPPGSTATTPHLVVAGSIVGSARAGSIIAGAGVLESSVRPDPAATYLAVRGPLTAAAVRAAGGPAIETFGDPLALVSRHVPLLARADADSLLFVRHLRHTGTRIELAEGIEEIPAQVSHPDDLVAFLERLAGARGVITSDPGVAVLCHSYGIPSASVLFDDQDPLAFVHEDSARGLELDSPAPTIVHPDLGRSDWEGLLAVRTPAPAVLDRIADSLDRAVATYLERVPVS